MQSGMISVPQFAVPDGTASGVGLTGLDGLAGLSRRRSTGFVRTPWLFMNPRFSTGILESRVSDFPRGGMSLIPGVM